MNIRDLQYIASVARNRSFAKAASQSFVSQPALSMQIKKLEDELGIKIFERTKKNFLITAIGEEILNRAEIILREVEEIKTIARNSNDPLAGEIKIGAFPTFASYFLPEFISRLHRNFPKLKIFLVEEKTDKLIKKLQNGELDCAFLANATSGENISKKIFSEKFLLAVPKNHELIKKQKITINDLRGFEIMLLEDGHCLREQAVEVCNLIGAVETKNFRASSLETLRNMVASGNGITFIPEIAVKKNDKIIYLNIKNAPERSIYLHWRKSSTKEELLQKVLQVALGTKT